MIGLASIKIKIIIYAAIISAAGAVFWYQNWQIDKLRNDVVILSENNVKLKTSVVTQKQTMISLETSLSDAIKNNNTLAKSLAKADKERQKNTIELNKYRKRFKNVALKKPTLIERRVNAASYNVLLEFEQVTNNYK